MAFPAAPTESGSAKLHFLTTDGNVAAGWFAIDTGATGTGTNTVGFAAVATHVHDDAAGAPGGLTTTSVPLVLVGGVRDDALGGLTPVEGDAVYLLVDANGALWTHDNALDAALAGTELQVDIVAALPVGANAIGKLAANSGVDIGDVDVTSITGLTMLNAAAQVTGDEAHDAADAGNPIKLGGRAQTSEAQPDEVADEDRVDALFDRSGYLRVRGDFDPSFADINDSASGNNTIIAAQAAGKRIAVWAILIVADGTVDVRWEDGAAGTPFTGQVPLQAREGYSISAGGIVPLFVGTAATLLNLELSANIVVHGFVSYTVIDD
ncbi:hypothetical protein LCGC14_0289130 [marine sediment metagenome]|uniref:Uncharacterized protein n=1 Tax=marine sediment metagenome TaxID=412755 RepID=A0A0F9WEZ8_9ZZZZ